MSLARADTDAARVDARARAVGRGGVGGAHSIWFVADIQPRAASHTPPKCQKSRF